MSLLNISTAVNIWECPEEDNGKGPHKSISQTWNGADGVGNETIPAFVCTLDVFRI